MQGKARVETMPPKPKPVVRRIELLDVTPVVWRRIVVANQWTFASLHHYLQWLMGWWDSHAHEFQVGDHVVAPDWWIAEIELDHEVKEYRDARRYSIAAAVTEFGIRGEIEYRYDMGDGWRHRLVIETPPPARTEQNLSLPACVAGENACPPEDAGGPHGYQWFLEAIAITTSMRTRCVGSAALPALSMAESRLAAEQRVELGVRHRLTKSVEATLRGDPARRVEETRPGRARERTAEADAPHAKGSEIRYGEFARPADQHVHGFRRNGIDHGRDLLARADPGRIQAVGADVRVGAEPSDRLLEIGPAANESFRTPDQQDVGAGAIDRLTRCTQPLDGDVQSIERLGSHTARILDRQACDAGLDREPHALGDARRGRRVAALEVGVDGYARRGDQRLQMFENPLAGHGAIRTTLRPREAGTRRRKRGKP